MGTLRKLTGAETAKSGADAARNMAMPFVRSGKSLGLKGLSDLFSGDIDLFAQPGVAKTFDAGAEALQRRLSASGFRGSGNELLSLADYTGNFTRNLYNDFFSQRMGLATMGANAAVGAGSNVVSGYNQSASSSAMGFGAIMDAAGSIGGATKGFGMF